MRTRQAKGRLPGVLEGGTGKAEVLKGRQEHGFQESRQIIATLAAVAGITS